MCVILVFVMEDFGYVYEFDGGFVIESGEDGVGEC